MELALPFGSKKVKFEVPYAPDRLAVARREPTPEPCEWKDAATRALASPVGVQPLAKMRLEGKTVVIIIDATPGHAPAGDIIPILTDHLSQAGAADEDITILAAGGDDPTTPAEMQRRLATDLPKQYTVASHNAFSDECRFCGFSALGTPILANKLAADADFRIALGRVQPHASRGYTGGDDAILPGVCSFETIIRHRALGFAPGSSYGHLGDNPAALDAQNVGMTVGLDYTLNYVVTLSGDPVAAFAGDPIKAHLAAVNFGDRMVWGAELGSPADLAIASPGHDWPGDRPFDPRAIDLVAAGVKLGGSIILLASPQELPLPEDDWERELCDVPIRELARLHEKRDWPGSAGEIAAKLRAVRDAYLTRRPFFSRSVILVGSDLPPQVVDHLGAEQTDTIQEAVEIVAARHGEDARVALVPDASTTLCLPEFH